jgi:hypothetical protein
MVSKNCIYLTHYESNTQIWLDYGEHGGWRDYYFYDNGRLTVAAFFYFINNLIMLHKKYSFENPITFICEKNDEFSIKFNGDIFHIDKNNIEQKKLFDDLLENIA